MVASTLFSLAVASSIFALARADAPWPTEPVGEVFNAGSQCPVKWLAATDSNWGSMSVELMTGANLNMISLSVLATGLDGSHDGGFNYTCPQVDINGPIYFIRFNSSNKNVLPNYSTRFTIASKSGATVPAPNPTQPDGSQPPWGIGHIVAGGNSTTSTTQSTSTTTTQSTSVTGSSTASSGGSRTSTTALNPVGTGSSAPGGGGGTGSGAPSATVIVTTKTLGSNPPKTTVITSTKALGGTPATVTTTMWMRPTTTTVFAQTSTATRFTTKYIQNYSTVTQSASTSTVTTTASSTTTVTVNSNSQTPSASSSGNGKAAKTSSTGKSSSGALRRTDFPVMHVLAFVVGAATTCITLLS